MGLIESPSSSQVQLEIDRTYSAARASLRPLEYATKDLVGGHYRTAARSGNATIIAAGGAIVSARNVSADRQVVLQRIIANAVVGTAFGTAQEVSVDLVRTINAVAGDTGGTLISLGES